jgi:FkbM family methyltransferase
VKKPSEKVALGKGGRKGRKATAKPKAKRRRTAGAADASSEVQSDVIQRPADVGALPALEEADKSAFSTAKTNWLFGEWEKLAAIDLAALDQHPDRDRLALLVAAAQQQLGRYQDARETVRLATAWGCDKQLLATVLVAGVHNTLGRAMALSKNDARAARHFQAAVAVGSPVSGSIELMGHARSVREVIKMGLLPDAAALMEKSLASAASHSERPRDSEMRLQMLEAELGLLRAGLTLAAQRKQLYGGPDASSRIADGEMSTSQLGQDLWVLQKTGHKRGGYFVEFGATNGILLSNTYLLENRYDWRGICAEPHPGFFAQLRKNRRCQVSDACIAGEGGRDVEFILADEYGGIADFANTDMHAEKRNAFRAAGKTMHLMTTSLDELLTSHRAPRNIDYLSIDTEGSEYEILKSFPFERWRIRCITVEHNYQPVREAIRLLLESHGYQREEAQWDDWYHLPE